jgi:hypothetical protein
MNGAANVKRARLTVTLPDFSAMRGAANGKGLD